MRINAHYAGVGAPGSQLKTNDYRAFNFSGDGR
jgi:hypothetical protein